MNKEIEEINDVILDTKNRLEETKKDLFQTNMNKANITRNIARYNISQKELEELRKEKRELHKTKDPSKICNSNLKKGFQDYLFGVKLIECIIGMIVFFTSIALGYLVPFIIVASLVVIDFGISISPLKKYTDKLLFKMYKIGKKVSLNKKIKYQEEVSDKLNNIISIGSISLEDLEKQEEKLLKIKEIFEEELLQLDDIIKDAYDKKEKIEEELNDVNTLINDDKPKVYRKTKQTEK